MNIKTKKRVAKSLTIDFDVSKSIEEIAKKNNCSLSKAYNLILKIGLQIHNQGGRLETKEVIYINDKLISIIDDNPNTTTDTSTSNNNSIKPSFKSGFLNS